MRLFNAFKRPSTGASALPRPATTGLTLINVPLSAGRKRRIRKSEDTAEGPESLITSPALPIKIRLAAGSQQQQDAGHLVKQRYAWRGYGVSEPAPDEPRLTVVAYDANHPIGTVGICYDSKAGLPCDRLYHHELARLRGTGRRLCEFTRLAVDSRAHQLQVLAALFHVAYLHAYHWLGFDDIVIEVNPRHVGFYLRALGFRQLGPQRHDQRVDAPAVLLHCELADIQRRLQETLSGDGPSPDDRSLFPHCLPSDMEREILARFATIDARKGSSTASASPGPLQAPCALLSPHCK